MQTKKRFLLLWLIALFILVIYFMKMTLKSNSLLHLTYDVDDVDDLPSFMDDWQPNLEVGRPPAAKTYEARQKMPFRTIYRKTNKNCRFDNNSGVSKSKYT